MLPSLKFAFSGCGFLIPFHFGVIEQLQRKAIITEMSALAGVSGGSFAAVGAACGMSGEFMFNHFCELERKCNHKDNKDNYEALIRASLSTLLPNNVHLKINTPKRVHISMYRLLPSTHSGLLLIDSFYSKHDVIDCLIASSFIPFFLAPRPMTRFRGDFVIDGGVSDIFPPIPGYVTVTPFRASHLRRHVNISADLSGDKFSFSLAQLLGMAIKPTKREEAVRLFECGQIAAEEWLTMNKQLAIAGGGNSEGLSLKF